MYYYIFVLQYKIIALQHKTRGIYIYEPCKSMLQKKCPFRVREWAAEIILLNSVGYAKLLDKDTEICLYNTRIIK